MEHKRSSGTWSSISRLDIFGTCSGLTEPSNKRFNKLVFLPMRLKRSLLKRSRFLKNLKINKIHLKKFLYPIVLSCLKASASMTFSRLANCFEGMSIFCVFKPSKSACHSCLRSLSVSCRHVSGNILLKKTIGIKRLIQISLRKGKSCK